MATFETQRDEFDAMHELDKQYNRLLMTPIVDDDYPEVRHQYEGALAKFIEAMKANGRFVPGNRYKVNSHE